MIGVIVASRKVGINPDNVATPIAASLGDLITLSLLAGISTGLYKELGKHTDTEGASVICSTKLEMNVWPGHLLRGCTISFYELKQMNACYSDVKHKKAYFYVPRKKKIRVTQQSQSEPLMNQSGSNSSMSSTEPTDFTHHHCFHTVDRQTVKHSGGSVELNATVWYYIGLIWVILV